MVPGFPANQNFSFAWGRCLDVLFRYQITVPVSDSMATLNPVKQIRICIGRPKTRAVCSQVIQRWTISPTESTDGVIIVTNSPLLTSRAPQLLHHFPVVMIGFNAVVIHAVHAIEIKRLFAFHRKSVFFWRQMDMLFPEMMCSTPVESKRFEWLAQSAQNTRRHQRPVSSSSLRSDILPHHPVTNAHS